MHKYFYMLTLSDFEDSSDSFPSSFSSLCFDEFSRSSLSLTISFTLKSRHVEILGYLSPNKSTPHRFVNLIISLSKASILKTKFGIVFPSLRARDLANNKFCFFPLLASSSFSSCLFWNLKTIENKKIRVAQSLFRSISQNDLK